MYPNDPISCNEQANATLQRYYQAADAHRRFDKSNQELSYQAINEKVAAVVTAVALLMIKFSSP